MPLYEYQDQQYDIETDDPVAAKAKILAHLGTPMSETTSPYSAAAKSAVSGSLPALGGMLGAGAAVAGATLLTGGVGTLPALGLMLAGGYGGGTAANALQEKFIEPQIPEQVKKDLGFDPELRARETKEHPYASFAGQLAPNLAFFRPGALEPIVTKTGQVIGTGTQRAMGAAFGGGLDAANQLWDKGTIDPTQLAMATAFQAVAAKPTALGKMLTPGHENLIQKQKEDPSFIPDEPTAIAHATDSKMYAISQIEKTKGQISQMQDILSNTQEGDAANKSIRERILVANDYMKEQTNTRDLMDEFLQSKLPEDQRRAAAPIDKDALVKEYIELGEKRHNPRDIESMKASLDRQAEIASILKEHDGGQSKQEILTTLMQDPEYVALPLEQQQKLLDEQHGTVAPKPNQMGLFTDLPNRQDISSEFFASLADKTDNQIRKDIWNREQRLNGMDENLAKHVQGEIEQAKQVLEARKAIDPMYSVNPQGEVITAPPLSRQLRVDIAHNNLRGALDSVANHPSTPRPLKAIAKFLLTNESIGKYSRLHFDDKLSITDRYGNVKPIDMGVAHGGVDVAVRNPDTISAVGMIHEAIHVATSGMMQAYGKDIHMPYHIKKAIENTLTLRDDLKGKYYNNVVKLLMEKMTLSEEQQAEMLRNPEKDLMYYAQERADIYLDNNRELLSYGLTDDIFRNVLNQIEVNGKSVYSRFKESVGDMFGWKSSNKRTALEVLYEAGDTLITGSTGQATSTPAHGVDPIYGFRDNKGDIGYTATDRFVNAIVNGGNTFASRMLSPAAMKKFWHGQKLIGAVADIAMQADRSKEFRQSRLLGGTNVTAVLEKASLFIKMSKQTNSDGLLGAMAGVTDKQMGEMMPEIIKAFRDGVNMTPDTHPTWSVGQKNLAHVIISTVDQMHTMTNESLGMRGLKPITKRAGYFPNVHIGEHYVDFHLNGVPVRREWFISEREATNMVDKITAYGGDFKALAGKKEIGADYTTIAETMQATLDKHSATGIPLAELIGAQIDTMHARADSVGSHQQHRGFQRGFLGDESAFGVEKNGTRFKKALEMWVQEYTESLRRREIATDSAKYMDSLESQQTRIDQPNAYAVARYFLNNELGILKSPYKGEISRMTNALVNNTFARIFPGVKLTDHVLSHAWNQMSRTGYNMILTSKPAIWATQALGFVQMGRGMFKEGSINPLTVASSAGKGFFRVLTGQYPPDMLEGMLHVAQNTDTFDKHMTNEVNSFMGHQDKEHISNKLRAWLSGEKFTSMADSYSRVVAWSMAYEHMIASGLKGEDAWMKAAEMTDDNLIRFGKKNLPGFYKELGAVGTMISPLKNYISGQMSNLAVDVKGVAQGVARAVEGRTLPDRRAIGDALALTTNLLGQIMMGGLISAPILADYEYCRQMLVQWGFTSYDALPDWTKFSASQGDVVHRGVIAMTGIDMGSSMRYQSMMKTGIDSVSNGIPGISMPISVTAKVIGGATTVAKNFIGGGVPDSKFDEALKGMIPAGYPAGIIDTLANSNREKETRGQRGNALTATGTPEKIARFIGSKSVEQANQTEALNVLDLKNKSLIPIKQNITDLILSSGVGDREQGLERAKQLMSKGQLTPEELKSMLLTQAQAKKKDMLLSKFTNKQGQLTSLPQARNLQEIKDMLYNKQ
jgi:hypothetical protein